MQSGWDQLQCVYFSSVCLHVMEEYFHSAGFIQHHEDRVGGIVFEGHGCYIEVSYEAETFPCYSPTLIIGHGSDVYDEGLNPTGVPFWFLIPPTSAAAKYTFWKFETETDLRAVLERIKCDVIQPFGRPLWEDGTELKKYVERFRREHIEQS